MRFVIESHDLHPVDVDLPWDTKDFVGSINGSLISFLGIPFAKPPCVSPASTQFYTVLTLVQNGKQALPPS